jgi:hypothetical protein
LFLIFTFAKNLFEKARKRMSDMMNDIQSELLGAASSTVALAH